MNELQLPKNEMLVVCYTNKPVPIAYLNVYEPDDIWIKINSCEDCPEENRKRCCKNCPLYTSKGCIQHLTSNSKPYTCVVNPPPNKVFSYCSLEFKCIKGKNKNKKRKIKELDFLREKK